MAGKDRGAELPRRIRGAAWTGSLSPAAPELSPGLRQCMQAAVKAERADALAREQHRAAGTRTAEQPRRTPRSGPAASQEAGPETSAPDNRTSGEHTAAAAAVPARPERIPGPVPGHGDAGWPDSAATSRPAAEPVPAVPPRPGRPRRR